MVNSGLIPGQVKSKTKPINIDINIAFLNRSGNAFNVEDSGACREAAV